jgi:hypothetical protein
MLGCATGQSLTNPNDRKLQLISPSDFGHAPDGAFPYACHDG